MQEQQPTNPTASAQKKVNLKSGIHNRSIPFRDGMTIGDIRKEYGTMYRIKGDEVAYSGTQALTDDTVVTEDMNLEFVKKAGEKGKKVLNW